MNGLEVYGKMKINEKSAFVFRQVNLVVRENPQRHIVEIRCVFQFLQEETQ